jgi:hypothetical protein
VLDGGVRASPSVPSGRRLRLRCPVTLEDAIDSIAAHAVIARGSLLGTTALGSTALNTTHPVVAHRSLLGTTALGSTALNATAPVPRRGA